MNIMIMIIGMVMMIVPCMLMGGIARCDQEKGALLFGPILLLGLVAFIASWFLPESFVISIG